MKYGKRENPGRLSRLIEQVFSRCGGELGCVRDRAQIFARLIEKVDPFIQKSTAEVCPHCREVCCINKHSYHTHFDVIYLLALGETIPYHKAGIGDSEPCQFLSPQGCRLRRFLRPYRCTWYFCMPLLEYIHNTPVREYRAFISSLEEISRERELLLTTFIGSAGETCLTPGMPLHEFY
jgi:hypothetical protein